MFEGGASLLSPGSLHLALPFPANSLKPSSSLTVSAQRLSGRKTLECPHYAYALVDLRTPHESMATPEQPTQHPEPMEPHNTHAAPKLTGTRVRAPECRDIRHHTPGNYPWAARCPHTCPETSGQASTTTAPTPCLSELQAHNHTGDPQSTTGETKG